MKRMLIILAVALMLLTGCGISESEYNNLKSDYDTLKSEYDMLSNDITETNKSFKELEAENKTNKEQFNEYFQKYGELYAETIGDDMLGAWGTATFGNADSALVDENAVLLTVDIGTATEDNIRKAYNQLTDGFTTLALIKQTDSKNLYLKFVDGDGNPIVEYDFIYSGDDSNIKMMISADCMDVVNRAMK